MTGDRNSMRIEDNFTRIYNVPPDHVIRAPGRVNLIGEHTDYNEGFVLPMAIDREVKIAARRRADRIVRMTAVDFGNEPSEFSLDAIERDDTHGWSNYVRGVASVLQRRGYKLPGCDLLIAGNVPIGAGLSSSAAIEVAAAMAFVAVGSLERDPEPRRRMEMAQICQAAENEFVGVKSGIMDPFVSALGREGCALWIDCRDLSYEYVPMPNGATIVVCDTGKRRGLVASEYNTRRAECEEAVRVLGEKLDRPLRTLRDVSMDEFFQFENGLPPNVARRARHVLAENARVLNAVAAMKKNDLAAFGTLMNESHASLRNDYEVSSPELDWMVEIAREQEGCLGARLTGAGFGGCTVNLVRDGAVRGFVANVASDYYARSGIVPPIYVCRAAVGAGVLK